MEQGGCTSRAPGQAGTAQQVLPGVAGEHTDVSKGPPAVPPWRHVLGRAAPIAVEVCRKERKKQLGLGLRSAYVTGRRTLI